MEEVEKKEQVEPKKKIFDTKFIVRAGIFSAMAALFYLFVKFPLPIFPSFLEFHFDEVPIFIASLAYGPIMGIVVLILKTLIKLPFTTTLCVGELSDLVYSAAFILPAAFIYNKNRHFKSAIHGILIGTVCQIIISVIGNIYVMVPFYMAVMEFPEAAILGMCQAVNPNITDIGWSFGLLGVLPFNAMKDAMIIGIVLPTYKSLHKLIDKIKV